MGSQRLKVGEGLQALYLGRLVLAVHCDGQAVEAVVWLLWKPSCHGLLVRGAFRVNSTVHTSASAV